MSAAHYVDRRGSNTDRRRRREWLVATFRADKDALLDDPPSEHLVSAADLAVREVELGTCDPACRCYRCGVLLTVDTVTADRIKPGIEGGTYRRNNIRPACVRCQSVTGGLLAAARRRAVGPAPVLLSGVFQVSE